ncbi:AMP-binding protein [Hymenobacter sp. HSC-4F20]|uniref:condensation domain-containing protein n=1 Tax=Hymenobacter sp. HSC-4F20 TaxID=2864135 RepID=UPI001C7344EF|nr:condensation domain-containing protein [Hymenobacter sp. HSC-4F20]MBX0293014.1 AMP-binding protein [Hymenobacter sp. HSC-4F20]
MKQIIHTLFEQQALDAPARTAVRHGSQTLTYGQLQQQVNAVAGACLQLEPTERGVVLVLLPKQPAVAAALLGVFKAGKVYLPVSWQLGDNTWRKIWQDIRPQLILTLVAELPRLEALLQRLQAEAPRQLLALDEQQQLTYYTWQQGRYVRQALILAPAPAHEVAIAPTDTCYLFFSSGTTGAPKVIEGVQRSLSHFIHWITKEFAYTEDFRVSQLAALTFDASLRDILGPLVTGGTLCIPPPDIMSNVRGLLQWLQQERITLMCTVPSVFRAMIQEVEESGKGAYSFPDLRFCLLAGETLYNKDVYRWQKNTGTGTELVNLYGTTESTMLKSFHRIGAASGKMSDRVSVGKPIANTLLLLINAEGKLCAVGEEGDVYIKTPFLTKGYYRDPQATAAVYVPNPLTQSPTDLVYKTGDVAKYLPDGTITLIGRKDGQVKLRGIRVDVAGVEAGILQHKDVQQVKCRVRETPAGDQYLVCYYAAHTPLSEEALRAYCQEHLNAYEVPDYLVGLEAFPINGHGKVDLAALPDPLAAPAPSATPAPEILSPTEQQLRAIWQQLLQVEPISATDNFFKIGGNSLKAIQLGASITRTMHLELGVGGIRQLFKAPTLRKFAEYLDELLLAQTRALGPIQPAAPQPAYPLSFAQQQIWLASQTQAGQQAYNMAQAYHLRGPLQPELLAQALQAVVARHESLRTSFHEAGGQITQRIHSTPAAAVALQFVDASGAASPGAQAEALIADLTDTIFDLTTPALLKLLLVALGPEEYALGFVMHHIVGDSWSGQILVRELLECYQQLAAGATWTKAPLAIHYKDYAVDEQARWQGEGLQQLQAFWQNHLGRKLPVLALPTDWPRTEQKSSEGRRYEFTLAPDLLATLQQVAAAHEVSLFALLLSAYYLVLNRYSTDQEIIVGVPVAVRSRSELVDQIGVYVNTLALKAHIDEALTLGQFLAQVQQVLLDGYAHQEYPFQEVVRHYAPARDAKHSAVFDVAINMLTSAPAAPAATGSLQVADWDRVHTQSKFDLTLYVYDNPEQGGRPFIEYKTALFKPQTIERFADRLVSLLGRFAAHTEQPLRHLLTERVTLPALKKALPRPALAQ